MLSNKLTKFYVYKNKPSNFLNDG